MEEKWKEIEGYSKYLISDYGRIWSKTRVVNTANGKTKTIRKGMFRKPRINMHGYETCNLISDDGHDKHLKVHRLVAMAFIPNPEKLRTVNHLNFDKTDNRMVNLEWASYSENIQHSYNAGRRDKAKEIAREVCRVNGKKNKGKKRKMVNLAMDELEEELDTHEKRS